MCGIYGIAKSPTSDLSGKDFNKLKKAIKLIAIDSEIRGNHSSGVATIGRNSMIYKSLDESSKFVKTKHFRRALKDMKDNNILLGHTRFATEGEISVANAHPFQVGNTIGTHNGCVYNIEKMSKKLDKNCPVDSQLIFKSIDTTENIQDAVKYFDSDFALAFIKDDVNILHLCREDNRPLAVGYWKDKKILFYASEDIFLEDAFLDLELDIEVEELPKNILHSFDVNKFTNKGTNCIETKFKYESRWTPIVTYNNYNNYNRANTFQDGTDDWIYRDDRYDYYVDGNLRNTQLDTSDFDYSKVDSSWTDDVNSWKLQKCAEYYGYDYRIDDENWFFDEVENRWYYARKNGEMVKEEDLTFGDLREHDETCTYCGEKATISRYGTNEVVRCGCQLDVDFYNSGEFE